MITLRKGYYPDDWEKRRKRVLQRDGYECQRCGDSDTVLQAHHKTAISDGGGHELSNLETICRSCHASEHPEKVAISIALENNQRLRMEYSSQSGTMVREIDPYGLAMHDGIQYLVGYDYYQEEIRIFRPSRIEWAHSREETYVPPSDWDTEAYLAREMDERRTDESLCFIATAACNSSSDSDVRTLRRFRDEVLDASRLTRWTIPVYYQLSPPVARWIRRSDRRRWYTRRLVIRPAVNAVGLLWKDIRTDE